MKNAFLDTADDIKWLNETHLRGVPLPTKWKEFQCAIMQGNEDSPFAVNLYLSATPKVSDSYYRVRFINDGLIYAEGQEYSEKQTFNRD